MPDQKRNDAERTSDRATIADPLGADAALRADENNPQQNPRAADDARAAFAGAAGNGGAQRRSPGNGEVASAWEQSEREHGTMATGTRMMAPAGAVGGSAVHATRDVLRGAIVATEDVASDLVGGVTHVAAEVVHGVRDVGYEVRDGATGLIGAVGAIGGSAVHTVADLLVDVVGGVRHVVGAAMGHNGHAATRTNGEERHPPSTPAATDMGDYSPAPHEARVNRGASGLNA